MLLLAISHRKTTMSEFASHILVVLAVLAISSLVSFLIFPLLLERRGVHMYKTKFGRALVFDSLDADEEPIRLLNVGGVFQSVVYTSPELQSELACNYHQSFSEAARQVPEVKRALIMGGGGFALPSHFIAHSKRLELDVVEIDPKIIEIAHEHFFLGETEALSQGRLNVICDDAWDFLKQSDKTYDFIVNDAFVKGRPLGPFTREEGVDVICSHLSEQGVYMANVRSSLDGSNAAIIDELAAIFRGTFKKLYLVPEKPGSPHDMAYNALIASNRELKLSGAREL